MLLRIAAATLLYSLYLALPLSQAAGQTLLRWKMQPGEKHQYSIRQQTSASAPGQSFASDQTMEVTWQVQSIEADGTHNMTQTFDRLQSKLNVGDKLVWDFDSSAAGERQGMAKKLGELFDALAHHPVSIRLTARGEALEIKFPEAMLARLKQDPQLAQFSGSFSEQGLKRMLDLMVLPEEAVMPGDAWRRHSENVEAGGKQELDATFTYRGAVQQQGSEYDKIDLAMTVQWSPGADQPAAKVEIKEQDIQGNLLFDNAGGKPWGSDTRMKLVMEISDKTGKSARQVETHTEVKLAD